MTVRLRTLAVPALLLLGGCNLLDPGGTGGPGPAASNPTTDLARIALQSHDQVRAGATPAPSPPLPEMQWSDQVESVAAEWASRCMYQHNAGRGDLGENIAASSPGYWPTIAGVVQAWASEAPDYDYASNTCNAPADRTCGHYTQIVWRSSTLVGCAYARCTQNSPFTGFPTWDFWVCDYSPPGNWVGQRPY